MFKDIFEKHPSLGMRHHLETVFLELSSHELTLRIQEFLKFICLQSLKDSGFIPVSTEETAHYWLIVDFLIKNHGFTLEKINKI
jgi:hypothetical protein